MKQSANSTQPKSEGVTASIGTFGLAFFLAVFFYFFTRPGTLSKPDSERMP